MPEVEIEMPAWLWHVLIDPYKRTEYWEAVRIKQGKRSWLYSRCVHSSHVAFLEIKVNTDKCIIEEDEAVLNIDKKYEFLKGLPKNAKVRYVYGDKEIPYIEAQTEYLYMRRYMSLYDIDSVPESKVPKITAFEVKIKNLGIDELYKAIKLVTKKYKEDIKIECYDGKVYIGDFGELEEPTIIQLKYAEYELLKEVDRVITGQNAKFLRDLLCIVRKWIPDSSIAIYAGTNYPTKVEVVHQYAYINLYIAPKFIDNVDEEDMVRHL